MTQQWRDMSRLMLHSEHAHRASSNANPHGITCGRDGCVCTHRGCVAGWIDQTRDDGTALGKEVAVPCPTCRPQLSEHLRKGGTPDSWREANRKGSAR